MLIADIPNAPPSSPAIVMVAQANANQQTSTEHEHVLGVCEILNRNRDSQVGIFPTIIADGNLHIKIDDGTAKISILQQPKHGILEPNPDWWDARYLPNDGYFGQDSFVVQVEGNGYKVKLHYYLDITEDDGESINPNPVCKGAAWKISQSSNGALASSSAAPRLY